jgi:hypothetical protein
VACVVRNPRTTTASSPRALWCFRWTGEWQAPDWKERPNKGNDIFDSPRGCNTWRPGSALSGGCALGRAGHDASAPAAGPPSAAGRLFCLHVTPTAQD